MTRVDTVPLLYRPFFFLFGWGVGLFFYLQSLLIHYTCRIRWEGTSLNAHPNYVLCIWHDSLITFFAVFVKMENQVWMNHPAWYMKPVHVLLRLTGVAKLCLGSSGHSGKEALAGVIGFLRQGYSTTVAVDGPAGPNHILKPGALIMGRDTGVPVIPLRFKCKHYFRLGRWDRKFVPLLFSEIIVQAGPPVFVTEENFERSGEAVRRWLNFE